MVRTALLPGVLFAFVMALPVVAPAAGAEQSAEAAEAAQVFESLFGADVARVAKTRDAKDDIDLAKRLLDTARQDAANKPALVAVLCEKAFGLAWGHPDGYATAVEAMEFLASRVPEQKNACAERLVEVRQKQYALAAPDAKAAAGESLIDALLSLVDVKLDADDLSGAAVACRRAQAIARTIRSERCDQIDARLKEMAGLVKAAREIENMKVLLARDPANVAAREKLVRLYLVDLDNPAAAAKHLEGVKDPSLKKYVPAAAKGAEAAPELACMELGEWYRGFGEAAQKGAKAAMFARAQAYYHRFLGLHTVEDLNRTAATVALKKVEAELAKLGPAAQAPSTGKPTQTGTAAVPKDGVIKPGKWIDLLKLVDPAKGVTNGSWKSENGCLVIEPHRMGWAAVPCAPQGSYQMSVGFVRTGGNSEVVVILPVGSSAVALLIGQFGGSSSALRNAPGAAATVKPGTLVNGQEYQLDIRVLLKGLTAEIDIYLNGKTYIRWEGLQSSLRAVYRLPNPSCIGLGADKSTVVFGSARLRMLSGEARMVPPQGK